MEKHFSKLIFAYEDSNKVTGDWNGEFHDALEEFPFVNASHYLDSGQSLSTSDLDSNKEEEPTVSIITEYTPDSPSSPSSAGLRHRRRVSQRSSKELSLSQLCKNNPGGLIDFDPRHTTVSPGKKYERSWSLKDAEKVYGKLNPGAVHLSSGRDGRKVNDQTDASSASSAITNVGGDDRINDEFIMVNAPNSVPNFMFTLSELVIKALELQTQLLASSVTFPVWLVHALYMFVTNPFRIMEYGRDYMLGNASGIWEICYSGVKWIVYLLIRKHGTSWKLCFRIGWGLLWLACFGFILIALLVLAFLLGGIIMKWLVEEPIQITEPLSFDYTMDTPMAFVPIISCPGFSSLEHSEKRKNKGITESRVIPFDHELQATVSLTLPESDYNRNLGIFQVRVDFLSGDGALLGTTRHPSMLQYKSQPIRLLSSFFKIATLLTGYSSETQTLHIRFTGYTEKHVPTSCSKVVIEQRAEFARGGGLPEIYAASIKLESQPPFIRRMLWYSKCLIYIWICIMIFSMELLFTLLCCIPIIFPWLRHGDVSSSNVAIPV